MSTPPTRDRRLQDHHETSFVWVLEQIARAPSRPLVVGLSAPQGSGKTTFARELVAHLEASGLRATSLSIDDFYLPRERQLGVAEMHPGNRILEHRGAPGTHDVALGEATLQRLSTLARGETTRVPAYDKTAHEGRGDRAPETTWPEVAGPLDVVVLEGWCLAFRAVPGETLDDPSLRPVNAALPSYDGWLRHVGALMAWRALALEQIVAWRVEAEERSRAAGRPGLDRAAAEDYIRRFLPVYETYQDTVLQPGPWADRLLTFTLDAGRLPVRRSTPSRSSP